MIVTPELLQAALVHRLEEVFPGEPVFEDVTRRDFQRPSNLVELQGVDLDPLSLGQGPVLLRYRFKLTTFTQVDEVHDSHLPVLAARAMLLLGAFAAGYLKAGDRAPKVTKLQADTSLYDCAEVAVTFELAIDRREFVPEELYPIMQKLNTRFLEKKEDVT